MLMMWLNVIFLKKKKQVAPTQSGQLRVDGIVVRNDLLAFHVVRLVDVSTQFNSGLLVTETLNSLFLILFHIWGCTFVQWEWSGCIEHIPFRLQTVESVLTFFEIVVHFCCTFLVRHYCIMKCKAIQSQWKSPRSWAREIERDWRWEYLSSNFSHFSHTLTNTNTPLRQIWFSAQLTCLHTQTHTFRKNSNSEIGRASCRERVLMSV